MAQMIEKGLGTVVSGPNRHPLRAADFCNIMGVHIIDGKSHDAVMIRRIRRPYDTDVGFLGQGFKENSCQRLLRN